MSKERFDKAYQHERRFLKNFLRCCVKWNGLPDTIFEPYLNDEVLFHGYVTGFKYEGDVVVSRGAISGIDMYERPVWFVSANHAITQPQRRRIGYAAAVCYNTPNTRFPEDFNRLVDIYAKRLADILVSEEVSLRNSRQSYVPIVKDEKEAIRMERLMNEIYDGEPTAIGFKIPIGKSVNDCFLPMKARENLIVDLLSDARRNVLADFYSELGIKSIAVDKKERTNLAEMSSNNQQLKVTSDILIKPRQAWCDEMNKLFGTNISVEMNDEEVLSYGIMEDNTASRAKSGNN